MPNTSLGITYPASTDHDRIWEHIQEVASDVDALLVAAPGTWTNYTPAWTSTGTAPAIGNGVITARYMQPPNSKLVHVSVRITFGSTSTFGTGAYSFSLPVAAATNCARVGSTYCRDTSAGSAGHFVSMCLIDPSAPTVVTVFNVNAQVGQTIPFTWANTDHITFTVTYEAA